MNGLDAWNQLIGAPEARWSSNTARFDDQLTDVGHRPKFKLGKNDRFFCIGSCFARNVEEHLIYNAVEVLSKRIVSPAHEYGARPNGLVNKFTIESAVNEIADVLHPRPIDARCFEEANGWRDLQLSPGTPSVTLARAIERRQYITGSYFARLREAQVVILTLGLIELWEDRRLQRFLNAAPSYASIKREPDRYHLHIRSVSETLSALETFRSHLHELNSGIRIVVTVSPVPMSETFSGQDVLTANTLSKSVLRAAAHWFAAAHDDVDYFPVFDMISSSPRATAFGKDCLHVSDVAVGKIMRKFIEAYLGWCADPVSFNEMGYLAANPDIEDAVRRGEIISGFHHWQATGRRENRPIAPPDGPTALMIAAGAA